MYLQTSFFIVNKIYEIVYYLVKNFKNNNVTQRVGIIK